MKLIIDSAIPYIKGVFEPFTEVVYKKGTDISATDVRECDGMIIRTRTVCDGKLLDGSNVKFIGTATIGFDHIDLQYCKDRNIKVSTAAGCNAHGVVQYVLAAMVALTKKGYNITTKDTTVGIIGVGNVGGALKATLTNMGFKVILNDPPRARDDAQFSSTPLEQLLEQSDIVTLHTPLTRSGEDKTFGMVDDKFFEAMNNGKKDKFFINASRGEVVNEDALLRAIDSKIISDAVIDVWCNEPNISNNLSDKAVISTPHIAGYSVQGKANGTAMMVNSASHFFGINALNEWYPTGINRQVKCNNISFEEVKKRISDYYNIEKDSAELKNDTTLFEQLRNSYHYREEFF